LAPVFFPKTSSLGPIATTSLSRSRRQGFSPRFAPTFDPPGSHLDCQPATRAYSRRFIPGNFTSSFPIDFDVVTFPCNWLAASSFQDWLLVRRRTLPFGIDHRPVKRGLAIVSLFPFSPFLRTLLPFPISPPPSLPPLLLPSPPLPSSPPSLPPPPHA